MKNILITVIVSATMFVLFVNSPAHYFSFKGDNLGTSVTTITSTDQLSNFPTVYNANLAALNAGKMEVSTTTLPLLTTLENLVTVGALNSGSLASGFTDVPVAVGGTGSSTPTGLLYGDGAGALTTLPYGTTGQFLISNGAGTAPTYQTSTADATANYDWTGAHTWTSTASTSIFAVLNTLYIGTTATSTIQGSTSGTSQLQGYLDVLGTSATSTFSGSVVVTDHASTTNLTVSGKCTGCLEGYEQVTDTVAFSTGDASDTTLAVSCSAGKKVLSGGYSGVPNNGNNVDAYILIANYPSSESAWTVTFDCDSAGACDAGTLTVYAVCALP